jgi:hypothetical protein
MSLFLFVCLATIGAYLWYNFLPRETAMLALAPDHHIAMQGGSAGEVACRMLTPPRREEAEFARFYIGCTDAGTPDNHLWIYAWHSWEDGRRFSKPARPINLGEAPEWNR